MPGFVDQPKSLEPPRMKVGFSANGRPAWTMRREERAGMLSCSSLPRNVGLRFGATWHPAAPSCSPRILPLGGGGKDTS